MRAARAIVRTRQQRADMIRPFSRSADFSKSATRSAAAPLWASPSVATEMAWVLRSTFTASRRGSDCISSATSRTKQRSFLESGGGLLGMPRAGDSGALDHLPEAHLPQARSAERYLSRGVPFHEARCRTKRKPNRSGWAGTGMRRTTDRIPGEAVGRQSCGTRPRWRFPLQRSGVGAPFCRGASSQRWIPFAIPVRTGRSLAPK
jgi:hypothetical protein